MKTTVDGTIPAVLTIPEAAKVLRGSDDPRNVKLVRRLVASGSLRRCRGPRAKGSPVLISAASVRQYAEGV